MIDHKGAAQRKFWSGGSSIHLIAVATGCCVCQIHNIHGTTEKDGFYWT